MSEQNQQPTPADGQAFLMQHVYIPVFFEKLAEQYRIVPQDEKQAENLLNIGFSLAERAAQEQTKQASAQGDFIALCAAHLDRQMGKSAAAPALITPAEEAQIKQATARLADDERFRLAMDLYQQGVEQGILR